MIGQPAASPRSQRKRSRHGAVNSQTNTKTHSPCDLQEMLMQQDHEDRHDYATALIGESSMVIARIQLSCKSQHDVHRLCILTWATVKVQLKLVMHTDDALLHA